MKEVKPALFPFFICYEHKKELFYSFLANSEQFKELADFIRKQKDIIHFWVEKQAGESDREMAEKIINLYHKNNLLPDSVLLEILGITMH